MYKKKAPATGAGGALGVAREITCDNNDKGLDFRFGKPYLTCMIKVDTSQIRRLAAELTKVQVKYAMVNAANGQATIALGSQVAEVRDQFTLRNLYTLNSLRMTKASTSRPEAETGSIQSYMAKQETGGQKSGAGGSGANIALPTSSGESENARERRRVVLPRYRMKQVNKRGPMELTNRGGKPFKSKKQAAFVAYKVLKKKRTANVMEIDGVKGVWAVIGGKLTFVQDLRYETVRVQKTEWHMDAIKAVSSQFEKYAVKRLEEQLRTARR